jgi:hypothetical protein
MLLSVLVKKYLLHVENKFNERYIECAQNSCFPHNVFLCEKNPDTKLEQVRLFYNQNIRHSG